MCETRDLGIKWPHWHTLIFKGDRKIDMRYVCPKDVKKMLLQQATTVFWKKWAAKREYEELTGAGSGLVAQKDEGKGSKRGQKIWFWKEVGAEETL